MTVDPIKHYSKEDVEREIVDYCRGRWVALEGGRNRERLFVRYFSKVGGPLKIDSESEFREVLYRFRGTGIRSIYGSVNIYRELRDRECVRDPENIIYSNPIWDVDGSLEYIDTVLKVAGEVCYILDRYGVSESVYLIWSGRGIHIHIHEHAFSEDVLKKYNPLDISYSTVEYIIMKVYPKIRDKLVEYSSRDRPLKVENKIDIQRVFTAPLSLHRIHDIVCVAFKPDEISDFDISWTNPSGFRHNSDWREFLEGEGDDLAEEAIKNVGTYFAKYHPRPSERITKILEKGSRIPVVRGRIGRFQVMAILQAAKYYILYNNIDMAKSFGLNRAIFYAWAKYYKPIYGYSRRRRMKTKDHMERIGSYIDVGGEKAFLSPEGWFTIGEQVQRPEDFDREIAKKIESVVSFKTAWEAAVDYVKRFPMETIRNQRRFYEEIYKPVRDEFIKIIQEYLAMKRMRDEKEE